MSGVTPSARGLYIALEGFDGVGKSTQARLLASARGAALTREPGATPLGALLRHQVLHADGESAPAPRTEALLFAADRAQHVAAVVAPALEAGRDVVTDRCYGSTLAYQGYGRGLPLSELRELIAFASRRPADASAGLEEVILPDVVVLLDAPLEHADRRVHRLDRMAGEQMSLLANDPDPAAAVRAAVPPADAMPPTEAAAVVESAVGAELLRCDTALASAEPDRLASAEPDRLASAEPDRLASAEPDRLEGQALTFSLRVWRSYRELCAAEPQRWVRVDATGTVSEVAARVAAAVNEHPAMRDRPRSAGTPQQS